MLAVLQFIFGSFWRFLGTLILLVVIGDYVITPLIRSVLTEERLRKKDPK